MGYVCDTEAQECFGTCLILDTMFNQQIVSKDKVSIELVGSWPPRGTIPASPLIVVFMLFAIFSTSN